MCFPFETYGFVPMMDMVEQFEAGGLTDGKDGGSNVAMYNQVCCMVDRDDVIEIHDEEVVRGVTPRMPIKNLAFEIGMSNCTGTESLERLSKAGAVYRNRNRRGQAFRFTVTAYKKNHDRLEKEGEVSCKTPFKAYYCLPYEDRTKALRDAGMLDKKYSATYVSIYDSVLSYVDRNHRVSIVTDSDGPNRKTKSYISGWTIVIGQQSLSRRSGVCYTNTSRLLNELVRAGLIERQKVGNKYRYRAVIWREALKRVAGSKGESDRDKSETNGSKAIIREDLEKSLEKNKEKDLEKHPPSPPNDPSKANDPDERETGADHSYLSQKADELAIRFNELFRGGKFMAKRLKHTYASKILKSLEDTLSEDRVRGLGERAIDMAVEIHDEVFNSLSFRQDSPYSPGYLFTEGGALALSGAMESMFAKEPKAPPPTLREPPPTLDRRKVEFEDMPKFLQDMMRRNCPDQIKEEEDAGTKEEPPKERETLEISDEERQELIESRGSIRLDGDGGGLKRFNAEDFIKNRKGGD